MSLPHRPFRAASLKTMATAALIALGTSHAGMADVGSDLKNFWERSGGGVNVTKPQAYSGQQAGYVTLGSLYLRTRPRTSNIASIQLPSIRAGCGGIDIFGGAFSFISKEELIALMEGIMQNSVGFAFELALESLSPATQEVVAKLRDLIQKVNASNINSCEAGQVLSSALWPRMEGASQHVCNTIGDYQGIFADRVSSRHGCTSGGKHSDTLSRGTGPLAEQNPLNVNYAWVAIKKNAFLASNRQIAEFFMTLTGTMITTGDESDDDAERKHETIAPRALSPDMAKALVEGGTVKIRVCDETSKCLNPTLDNVTISASDSLYAITEKAVQELSDAISMDQPPPAASIALINLTSIPIYEHLITAKSYKYHFVDSEISSMAELIAVDLAMAYIDEGVSEIIKSASNVSIAGGINREFQAELSKTKSVLQQYRAAAQRRYAEAIRNVEHLQLSRETLASHSKTRFGNLFGKGDDL